MAKTAIKTARLRFLPHSPMTEDVTSHPPVQAPTIASAGDPGDRHRIVSDTAYFLAQQEGFPAGREVHHWLQAEVLVDTGRVGRALRSGAG